MPPSSYIYSYNIYDIYKHHLMKLICCCYGWNYFNRYGDKIILYIIGVMESNYGKDIEDWEILDETDLADYIKEMNIHV